MSVVPVWLEVDVSRETLANLAGYVELVKKWNPKINLISKSSVSDIWDRHIWDAVQIAEYTEFEQSWADLGSGGGFPGLVMSILAKEAAPDMTLTLIESDQRKSAFLRTVIRELKLKAHVDTSRVEAAKSCNSQVVSARALADLNTLLAYAERHCAKDGVCVFPKGATWEKELKEAQQNWSFSYSAHRSKTNTDAAILTIRDIKRV